ncbi:MAG: ABC transporter permease [Hyphomicrobiales bacterium]|nr:ABC transporter permease [Hyphomicrobiales bacterium]
MVGYVIPRLLRGSLTVFLIATVTFFVLRLSGDPALEILTEEATADALEAFRQRWGLDEPLWWQYLNYLQNLFTGNFGLSMRDGRPVTEVLAQRIPATLLLAIPAFLLKFIIGIPLGVLGAIRKEKLTGKIVMFPSVVGISVPSFVLALTLIYFFSVGMKLLPIGGNGSALHHVLPILTLAVAGSAVVARYTQASVIEVLGKPHVLAALARGQRPRALILRHILPNALIPLLTIAGFLLGGLIGGAIVTETVFAWPGVGRLLVMSVEARDVAVVQAILMLVGATMVVANAIVDLLYSAVDPRVGHLARG